MIKFKPFTCQTNGQGLWSRKAAQVKVTKLLPDTVWDKYITFIAFFPKKDWNPDKDGLIYTDPQWIKDFRKGLIELGIPKSIADSIDYTEQGMQGDDYVSVETNKNKFAELMGWEIEED